MRIPALLLVLLTACSSQPVLHGDGVTPGPTGTTRPPVTCKEVSRSRCDAARCKGDDLDYVVLQCTDGRVTRCEISKDACH
jgi:hypothetical protein